MAALGTGVASGPVGWRAERALAVAFRLVLGVVCVPQNAPLSRVVFSSCLARFNGGGHAIVLIMHHY